IFNVQVLGSSYHPLLLVILPPGAFIVLGFLLGFMNHVEIRLAERAGRTPLIRKEHDCATCAIHRNWFSLGTEEQSSPVEK
ncbi:MAG: hypothetical protein KAX38_03250, partial [Candidatus Krumholzibacteria bacterium]|nr:hypothetical protein [Candidatus Krumholzibacteria bacterium]